MNHLNRESSQAPRRSGRVWGAGGINAHFLLLLACALPLATVRRAVAQASASVTVRADSSVGVIPPAAFGVNTAVWDGLLLDPNLPFLLRQAGASTLRFPGGSTADVYHWQNHSVTAGSGQYLDARNPFDAFMGVAQGTGVTPVITVHYGSNPAGTGGADPSQPPRRRSRRITGCKC